MIIIINFVMTIFIVNCQCIGIINIEHGYVCVAHWFLLIPFEFDIRSGQFLFWHCYRCLFITYLGFLFILAFGIGPTANSLFRYYDTNCNGEHKTLFFMLSSIHYSFLCVSFMSHLVLGPAICRIWYYNGRGKRKKNLKHIYLYIKYQNVVYA